MVLNTITVGAAVAPVVIKTYTSHYVNRKPRRQRPTAHISYDEGLNLIRRFLQYASFHTIEEIQAFTSQWVPTPRWVKVDVATIPEKSIEKAAAALIAQLDHQGIDKIGGSTWWQWRREADVLKAEWIEMRGDYEARRKSGDTGKRVMLYVHGGAYFFGSVDEHRYQLQRHARKLKARVFARYTRYRLAPQFPFPCGLLDCLAAYLYLLTDQEPSTIVLAGDSAGGGMIVSLLVTLRDQGIPLPAGAVLISPWVDLTHSFPSVAGDNSFDYIPEHGFLAKPSPAWPPPNSDDMQQIAMHAVEQLVVEGLPRKSTHREIREAEQAAVQGFHVDPSPKNLDPEENPHNPAGNEGVSIRPGNTIPGEGHDLSIMIDGKMITIKDQIQMYTTNQLISHPLVSPVLQPSLGGLPPLLILTGGGEVLRDEQIYLAHKAANPSKYPPGDAHLKRHPEAEAIITKFRPTDVQLQVWDDLCHVAPTLSFTRPAKYMFRSIAQFSAWALARAQQTDIEIVDDDDVSVISDGTDSSTDDPKAEAENTAKLNGSSKGPTSSGKNIGRAGDALPPFRNHMIRQRVDRHGLISSLGPPSSLPALQVPVDEIGVIKPEPVKKWLKAKQERDGKFAKEKRHVQKQRVKEMAKGFQGFGSDEAPPPSALAGRRGVKMPRERKKQKSWGMSLWSLWGSSHDKDTIAREEKADKDPVTVTATAQDGANAQDLSVPTGDAQSRSRSRHRTVHRRVSDQGQVDDSIASSGQNVSDETRGRDQPTESKESPFSHQISPALIPLPRSPGTSSPPITPSAHGDYSSLSPASFTRPSLGGVAFPFNLGRSLHENGRNASTFTLTNEVVVAPPELHAKGLKETTNGTIEEDRLQRNADGADVQSAETDMGRVVKEVGKEAEALSSDEKGSKEEKRPEIERFVTAPEL